MIFAGRLTPETERHLIPRRQITPADESQTFEIVVREEAIPLRFQNKTTLKYPLAT
jgi:hypothetical protein